MATGKSGWISPRNEITINRAPTAARPRHVSNRYNRVSDISDASRRRLRDILERPCCRKDVVIEDAEFTVSVLFWYEEPPPYEPPFPPSAALLEHMLVSA